MIVNSKKFLDGNACIHIGKRACFSQCMETISKWPAKWIKKDPFHYWIRYTLDAHFAKVKPTRHLLGTIMTAGTVNPFDGSNMCRNVLVYSIHFFAWMISKSKEEELETVGELSNVCARIVFKCLYLARIGRLDILWSVYYLAISAIKRNRPCN